MNATTAIAGLGARTDHVATVPNLDVSRLNLSPEERRVLSSVGRVSRIDDVLSRSGLDEPRAIALLLSLRAKGAIVPARVVNRAAGPVQPLDAAMAEEVELDPERKKEILELDRALDTLDHFTVLGVKPGAPAADVKQAYYSASRRFHPDRFFGKNLGSYRARVERIFRRLTEAQEVLTDEARRAAYLKAHPALAAPRIASPAPSAAASSAPSASAPAPAAARAEPPRPPSPEDEARRNERQARLARHPYLARTHRMSDLVARGKAAIARGEFEKAYSELNQAIALDPKNRELTALVAEARRRHEEQRGKAEVERGAELEKQGDLAGAYAAYRKAQVLDGQSADAAFRAARVARALGQEPAEVRRFAQASVDLAPDAIPHRLLLAQVLTELGDKKLAKHHYEAILKRDPQHAEAKEQVKKARWPF
ncbi:DnaJ domain-containing protein [Myxococcaceae bacterium GXIMD 01537]